MALNGTIRNTFKSPGWRLEMDWSATQNLATNQSTVTTRMYLVSLGGYYAIYSSSTNDLRSTIDGTTYTGSFSPALKGNQRKLIHTATKVVNHNSDGRKSLVIGGSADLKVTLSGQYIGTVTLPNTTITLNTIPRASSMKNTPNFNIGNTLAIQINKASPNFRHTIEVYVGTTLITSQSGVNEAWSFVPTSAQINQMYNLTPNSNSIATKVVVKTYSGGTLLGTTQKTGTARVTNSNPLFSSFSFTDTNTAMRNRIGDANILAQNKSLLTVYIYDSDTATAVNGATMKEFQISIGSYYNTIPYSAATQSVAIGALDLMGRVKLSVKAVDSRGNFREVIKNITFLPYQEPLIKSSAQRYNNFETMTTITIEGTMSPLIVGTVRKNNIRSVAYSAVLEGGSHSYTTLYGVTYSGDKFELPAFNINLDNDKNWDISIRVDDNVQPGYSYQTISLKRGVPPWLFEGEGNIRLKGGLVTTGNEKTLSDNGYNVERFDGITGTDAGLRAFKMGDNSTGRGVNTKFPSSTGAWAYFQGADVQGDTNGDFILWKDRQTQDNALYVGFVNNGEVGNFGKIVTVVDEGSYSRSGTTGYYTKYSDGRLEVEWERIFTSSNFRGSGDIKNWITGNIYFMSTAFNSPPVITTNSSMGEIFGIANRQVYNNYFNLRLYGIVETTNAITLRGIAQGRWK